MSRRDNTQTKGRKSFYLKNFQKFEKKISFFSLKNLNLFAKTEIYSLVLKYDIILKQ